MQANDRPAVPLAQRTFGEIVYWITVVSCILCTVGMLVAFTSDMEDNVLNPKTLMDEIFDGVPAESVAELEQDVVAGDTVIYLDDTKDFEEAVDTKLEKSGVELIADVVAGDTVLSVAEMEESFIAGNFILIEDDDFEEFAIIEAVDVTAMTVTVKLPLLNSYVAANDAEITELDPKKVILEEELEDGTTIVERRYLRAIDEDNDALILMEGTENSYSMDGDSEVQEETIWRKAKDDVEGGHFWKDHLDTGDGIIQLGLVLGCSVGAFALLGAAFVLFFKEKSYGWGSAALWVAFMIIVSVLGLVSFH